MKVFSLHEIGEIIQRINDSQINAQLTWYDLEGFDYVVGDSLMGYKKTIPHTDINWLNLSSVVSALACDAAKYFPETSFAKWYKGNC
ncbi:MAG TPA: hypothetical protein VE467_09305 [Chryseolinea sp.]|jgi:hypothetical protein|nr:hypothetical protein [Chryseolinea sp.]